MRACEGRGRGAPLEMGRLRRIAIGVAMAGCLPAAMAAAPAAPDPQLVAHGAALFSGRAALSGGGAACIACHTATNPLITLPGGRLAMDLTGVGSQIGSDGIKAMLASPPSPAMVAAYDTHPIADADATALAAFLVATGSQTAPEPVSRAPMLAAGLGGLAVILALMHRIWGRRKVVSTKHAIHARQRPTR